jgi:hypothetical protein
MNAVERGKIPQLLIAKLLFIIHILTGPARDVWRTPVNSDDV